MKQDFRVNLKYEISTFNMKWLVPSFGAEQQNAISINAVDSFQAYQHVGIQTGNGLAVFNYARRHESVW